MLEPGLSSINQGAFRRMPGENSLDDLMAGVTAGDESAFAVLYDMTSSAVYGIAVRMLGNAEDAEEATLDVYNQVWRSARTFSRDRGTVMAWLLTLARTRSLDKLRARASRSRNIEPISERFDAPAEGATPEEQSAASEQRQLMLAALGKLPHEQRQVLELAYFQGLSHAELAERLGQPLGTIKTRIRLGMMKLKEHLLGGQKLVQGVEA